MGKWGLLLSLLVVHFLAREQTANTMPGKNPEFFHDDHGYFQCYRVSLSLLAGHGFRRLSLPGPAGDPATDTQILRGTKGNVPPGTAPCPEAEPIVQFINLQRLETSQQEFKSYIQCPFSATEPCDAWETTRIWDIYFTALIWRIFGISWPVYYTFASLASTGTCLLIFIIARKLSGSYWAGLLAALLFFASPFENQFAIRSLRDISPLWFGTLAFAFFVCVVERFNSQKLNCLSIFGLGMVAMVGRGWRVDVLILIPFFLAALTAMLMLRQRSWQYVMAAVGLFLCGAWVTDGAIRLMCPGERQGSENAFHVALYGTSTRSNILHLENGLQIPRDDIQTFLNAEFYHEKRHGGELLTYIGRPYGITCGEMFLATVKYDLYHYLRLWPEFYIQAVSAFPEPDRLQSEKVALLEQSRLPWANPLYESFFDPLTRGLPYLHFLGIVALLWIGKDKIRGGILILFAFYYSLVWFFVLPEQKHLGQMLLPLTISGGIGLWALFRLFRFLFFRLDACDLPIAIPKGLRIGCWIALGICASWIGTCALAYPYSMRQRARYLAEVATLAAKGHDAKQTIRDPRLFSAYIDPDSAEPPTGYVLAIQAGADPGYLTCRHVHFPSKTLPGRLFITRHKLHPGRLQYFAVSCIHATKLGENRAYACSVILNPGSNIVSSRKLDLSEWKRLPFGTVFYDGEKSPGSPSLGAMGSVDFVPDALVGKYFFNNLSSEMAYGYPWELLTVAGLPFHQNFEFPELRPVPLIASHEEGEDVVLRSPRNVKEDSQSGLPLQAFKAAPGIYLDETNQSIHPKLSPEQTGVLGTYPLPRVPESGIYLLKVKYRQIGMADLVVKAVRLDGKDSPKQCCLPQMEGDCLVKFLEVKLNAGDSIQIQLINQLSTDSTGHEFIIQEIQAYREKNPLWELIRDHDGQ
jgi:hypothetical protein